MNKLYLKPVCKDSAGFVLSYTYSGWVLAVGLSIETVKIPLLVVDVRHLVDKQKRFKIAHKRNRYPKMENNSLLAPLNDSYLLCCVLFYHI